jgi:hypothetical protein
MGFMKENLAQVPLAFHKSVGLETVHAEGRELECGSYPGCMSSEADQPVESVMWYGELVWERYVSPRIPVG